MSVFDDLKNAKQLQLYKRLKFLDFLLAYRGWFTRQDLIEEFKIAPAGATRDIAVYKEFTTPEGQKSSSNVDFNDSSKQYVRKESFRAKYPISFENGISILRRALKKGSIGVEIPIPVESPESLSNPKEDVLAILSRAIGSNRCLVVRYGSLSSGDTERKIFPHSFFESENSWYVRAYCYKRNEFRTFKLTRFTSLKFSNDESCESSNSINDHQWQRRVKLILEPHPERRQKPTLAHDFQMKPVTEKLGNIEHQISDCAKEVKVRAAVCGFWLQHWNVDCSDDGRLGKYDPRYQLKLANPETLYDVESAHLAPGRNKPSV